MVNHLCGGGDRVSTVNFPPRPQLIVMCVSYSRVLAHSLATRICDKKTSGSGQKAIGRGGAKIKVNQGRENNAK